MRLFRPLSWISQSRGNSPVASAQADSPPMMAPSADVANGFNAHAAAHNERVYGGSKRKVGENSQKGNREITDFFSSSPMGAESSKIAGGERESKKRRLNLMENDENDEHASARAREVRVDDKIPRSAASRAPPSICYTNGNDDKPQARKLREERAKMKASAQAAQRVHKDTFMREADTSERDRKRELIKRRMQNDLSTSQSISLRGGDVEMHGAEDISENATNDMRDLFLHQINLETKLQHETLQEIRCEIAKSQIALEQLRRCHLIPFPQTYADPEAMLNIMDGTGPSIPQANGTQPKWASPFGVTEGAYTRHYAKWLIPDERFDGVHYEQQQMAMGSGYPFPNMAQVNGEVVRMDGRQTRNSFQLDPVPKNKRRSRGDVTAPLQALSSGYAQKKEDAGPSVLKRNDGQWVKLVCIDCQRENFGSTQGFINHCRIAHRREFKSHEEAAVNSGHVVEVDHAGCILGDDKEKIPISVAYEGLVHHKIKQTPIDWTKAKDVLQHVNDALREFREGKLEGVEHIPGARKDWAVIVEEPKASKGFSPAAATPHLSALLAKTGFNKSLDTEVAAAKAPVPETIEVNSDNEDEDMDDATPVAAAPAKESHKSSNKPTPRISFRPPILPSMRPSSSSINQSSHAPILPPPRINIHVRSGSSSGDKAQSHTSPQASTKSPTEVAKAKAREVQSRINEAARKQRTATTQEAIIVESDDTIEEEDVMIVGVGVLRGGDMDIDREDLSPTAHSEGGKAPSLVSDDDDYTAESHDEEDEVEDEAQSSEGEGIEVRDELDEARSRKRTESREEEAINVRGSQSKTAHAKKGVTFASPVQTGKSKGRAVGKAKK